MFYMNFGYYLNGGRGTMREIERIYNKYLIDILDKIILGVIIIYGILLVMIMIIGNGTFEKTIVNRILDNLGGIISWTIGLIPVIRYYRIIITDNVLENITPKNYNDRLLEVIKLYGGMIFVFLCLLTMHKLIFPIFSGNFNNASDIIYSYQRDLSTISFFVMGGLFCIMSSVKRNQQKVNSVIIVVIAIFVFNIQDDINKLITTSLGFDLHSGVYSLTASIGINVCLSFIFIFIILKNINKFDTRKIYV